MGYLHPITWVYGRTRKGTSPVPKEQVRRLKERYPYISIMIIPEPCQGKAALILAKLSVQYEHKASQLHFYLFLMELSPLTPKPMWLWIQQCFLPFLTFTIFYYLWQSLSVIFTNSNFMGICSFLNCKVAVRDSFSLLTGWGRRGRTVQEILTSLLFPKQWNSCTCLRKLSMC